MAYPKPTDRTEVIAKYGRAVHLSNFAEPDGTTSEWLLFSSSKHPVIVFPLTISGGVAATLQYRYGVNEPVLELPGGLVEEGERWEETARRELLEEAGHSAESFHQIGPPVMFDPCCYSERFVPVLAVGCMRVAEPSAEHVTDRAYGVREWYRAIREGEVKDCKTIAVSLLALPHLPREYHKQALEGLTR